METRDLNTTLHTTPYNSHAITSGYGAVSFWAKAGAEYETGHWSERSAVNAVRRKLDKRDSKSN
jgi:hypothetical protein